MYDSADTELTRGYPGTRFRDGAVWRSRGVESAKTITCPFGSDHATPGIYGSGI